MTKRFLAVAALLTALLGMLPGTSALAARPDAVGWWQRTSAGPLAAPAPPDVPEGGILVEGVAAGDSAPATPPPPGALPAGEEGSNETGYRAIGALRFSVPAGAIPTALTLTVAGGASPEAQVLACAGSEPFEAAHGGAWDDKPAYDCSSSATATVGEDGTLSFSNVDALLRGDALTIVLLPGGAMRVAIEPPGDDALAVTEASTGSTGPSSGSGDTGFSSEPSGSTASPSGSAASPSAPAGGSQSFDAPATAAPDATLDAAPPADDLAAPPADDPPPVQSTTPASSAASEFPTGPAFGTLFVVAAAAALLWRIPSRYPVVVRQSATGRTPAPS